MEDDESNRLDGKGKRRQTAIVPGIPVPPTSHGAPIAHFDEGFSSDGACLSGAETEKDEATPTDHESDGNKTPMFELPRGERQPFSMAHGSRSPDDDEPVVDSGLDHQIAYSHSEEDILKGIVAEHKETDEARTSLLMQQESFDTDFDECSQSDSYRTAASTSGLFGSTLVTSPAFVKSYPTPASMTASTAGDLDTNENLQLKKEFEIQAISRPRCTTPVSSCVIESFIASSQEEPERKMSKTETEKLKISIPGAGTVGNEAVSPQQGRTKHGHSRKGSKTWSEFYENMTISGTSGRVSGRTTPMSERTDDDSGDIFDRNPDYQQKVPPSPVVHRRSSTDWVNFDAQADEGFELKMNGDALDEKQQKLSTHADYDSSVPAVAAAVSASIAALSHGAYFDGMENTPETKTDHQFGESYQKNEEPYGQNYSDSWQQPEAIEDEEVPPPIPPEDYHTDQYSYEPTTFEQSWDQATNNEPLNQSYPYEFQAHGYDQPAAVADQSQSYTTESFLDIGSIEQNPAYNSEMQLTDYSGTATTAGFTMPDEMYSGASLTDSSQVVPDSTDFNVYPETSAQYALDSYTGYANTWDEDVSVEPAAANTTSTSIYETPAQYTDYMTSWNDVPGATLQGASTYMEGYSIPTAVESSAVGVQSDNATNYYPSSWDDDASEVPQRNNYQSKPPWAYHNYQSEEKETVPPSAKPPPVPPPPKRPPKSYETPKKYEKPVSPKQEEPAESGQSKEWLEYQRMTDKINLAMKQTKDKLQEMKETTIVQNLPNRAYDIKVDKKEDKKEITMTGNLLDMDIEENVPKPEAEESKSEWKPIHERLDEEIKKQKELNKPRRPPPPKGTPQRPPPPSSKAKQDYQTSWDDDDNAPPPPKPEPKIDQYLSAWNDDSAVGADYVAPSYVHPTTAKLDFSHFEAPSRMEDSNSSSVLLPPPPPLDASQISSPLFNEDDLLPPPPPPISNATNAAADLDDFFGAGSDSAAVPPVPPPRSPLVERPPQHPASKWEDTFDAALPSSESGFFQKVSSSSVSATNDPFAAPTNKKVDLFSALEEESVMAESYDPFNVKPIDVIVAEAKAKSEAAAAAHEAEEDLDFFGLNHKEEEEAVEEIPHSPPLGFADEFLPEERDEDNRTPSPLYDEDDSLPLKEFPPAFTGDGWELMLRYPLKKKIMGERYWKAVFVKLSGNTIQLYYSRNDKRPFQELPLQSNYCMSDITLQQYDIYGKIHTVKVQYVLYKERVGVRPGQIPKLVEGKLTKLGLPLEHAAQTTVLLKFGSLNHIDMQTFVHCVEDVLFKIPSARERPCMYKQDEIQVHCYDEYSACVNKDGAVSDQRARVRIFCLAFISGMPFAEIGLNDRRRQGKEVVRRKDIMPMFTERWIRFEDLQFHSSVEKPAYDKDHVIKMRPLDATFFEVLRFRVRPPRGKELPLQVRSVMKLAGSKIEIRLEVMVAGFKSRKARQVPCEDIQIRFPIPEAWIYLFREERHWGYGSVHAKVRRPGKVKNIKDRLMGMVQHVDASLIEAAIGDAKYEHVYRALVWRIPRLPEKHHGAYKTHLLRCRFELNSFDLMPESFIPNCDVEFTMPVATVSHTVVRSVSIEQNEDPDRVEKWVRYLAKYQYKVETDYVQTADLDIDAILDMTVMDPEKSLEKPPALHKPSIDVDVTKDAHAGYRIEFAPGEFGEDDSKPKKRNDSSSDSDDEDSRKPMVINIDMKGYGY